MFVVVCHKLVWDKTSRGESGLTWQQVGNHRKMDVIQTGEKVELDKAGVAGEFFVVLPNPIEWPTRGEHIIQAIGREAIESLLCHPGIPTHGLPTIQFRSYDEVYESLLSVLELKHQPPRGVPQNTHDLIEKILQTVHSLKSLSSFSADLDQFCKTYKRGRAYQLPTVDVSKERQTLFDTLRKLKESPLGSELGKTLNRLETLYRLLKESHDGVRIIQMVSGIRDEIQRGATGMLYVERVQAHREQFNLWLKAFEGVRGELEHELREQLGSI